MVAWMYLNMFLYILVLNYLKFKICKHDWLSQSLFLNKHLVFFNYDKLFKFKILLTRLQHFDNLGKNAVEWIYSWLPLLTNIVDFSSNGPLCTFSYLLHPSFYSFVRWFWKRKQVCKWMKVINSHKAELRRI